MGGRQYAMQRDLGIQFSIGKDIRVRGYGGGGGEREKKRKGEGRGRDYLFRSIERRYEISFGRVEVGEIRRGRLEVGGVCLLKQIYNLQQ